MTRLIRAEARKLATTTWFKLAMAAAVVMGPISAVSNALTAKGSRRVIGSTASIHHILSSAVVTSMVMLGVGIAVMAGEYRHRTSVPTFLITPRRRDVVMAKLAAVSILGAVLGAVVFGEAVGVAIPALSSRGVHHLARDTAQMWVGSVVASALFGALGVALGALTRSTVVAIVAAISWAMFFEVAFLDSVWPSVGKWLPAGTNVSLTHTADHLGRYLSPIVAAAVLVGWTVVLTGSALVVTTRREV